MLSLFPNLGPAPLSTALAWGFSRAWQVAEEWRLRLQEKEAGWEGRSSSVLVGGVGTWPWLSGGHRL